MVEEDSSRLSRSRHRLGELLGVRAPEARRNDAMPRTNHGRSEPGTETGQALEAGLIAMVTRVVPSQMDAVPRERRIPRDARPRRRKGCEPLSSAQLARRF